MSKKNYYDEKFYTYNVGGSYRSAEKILRHLNDYITKKSEFNSIVDFGCGRGTWLKAALELGVQKAVGYDGDWNKDKIIDDRIIFNSCDLRTIEPSGETFDIAISLEVAEHLPKSSMHQIVNFLTSSSDVVIFGAAFPLQGGTDHINEQFPESWYQIFDHFGYCVVDLFRERFWDDEDIESCYRQNTFLYIRKNSDIYNSGLFKPMSNTSFMNCMHPDIYLRRSGRQIFTDFSYSFKQLLKRKGFK
jgi:cyclopropane fatty-acyl-phospholipid synthase-like methyltransferase